MLEQLISVGPWGDPWDEDTYPLDPFEREIEGGDE